MTKYSSDDYNSDEFLEAIDRYIQGLDEPEPLAALPRAAFTPSFWERWNSRPPTGGFPFNTGDDDE